ncbi:hypothetical protein LI328DRAFT_162650 [Trichoderma asperelloides]|nr:hypothetical protein LI328DRAFT_162650 [Trichoderma asperelloides]
MLRVLRHAAHRWNYKRRTTWKIGVEKMLATRQHWRRHTLKLCSEHRHLNFRTTHRDNAGCYLLHKRDADVENWGPIQTPKAVLSCLDNARYTPTKEATDEGTQSISQVDKCYQNAGSLFSRRLPGTAMAYLQCLSTKALPASASQALFGLCCQQKSSHPFITAPFPQVLTDVFSRLH